jgi:hypothetical protein
MLFEIDGIPSFEINLFDNSVAREWKKLINSIYVGDGEDIDHRRSFYNLRTKKEIKNDLLNAIKKINIFFKKEFIVIPKKINWNNQKIYNDLHIYFEKLSGNFDNPTKLIKIAPRDIKESIRDLNYCVHALENFNDAKKDNIKIQWTKFRTITPRVPLKKDDYNLIKFKKLSNEVYLSYNELGKNYIDCWKDGLNINYSSLKNNHYIGADFFISLKKQKNIFHNDFIQWMRAHNLDPYEKKHGIGLIAIGTAKIININHLTKNSKVTIIKETL